MFNIASILSTSSLLIILFPVTFHRVVAEALFRYVLILYISWFFTFTVETFVFLIFFQFFNFKYWSTFVFCLQIPEGISLIRINAII